MLNIDDVINALNFVEFGDNSEAYYHPKSGKIVYQGFDIDEEVDVDWDEDEIIQLPDKYDINKYHAMELFIDRVEDEEAREWLSNAIRGRGAFRMFRATCQRFGLLQKWYDFEEKYMLSIAVEWCVDNGIEYELKDGRKPLEKEFDWYDEEQFKPEAEEVKDTRKVVKDSIRFTDLNKHNLPSTLLAIEEYTSTLEDTEPMDLLDHYIEFGKVVLASDQGRIVGFACVDDSKEPIIEVLYIRKTDRRKKIGTSLLKHTIEEYKDEVKVRFLPKDKASLLFMLANGYDVLESIQLKQHANETDTIQLEENFYM